jgi:hypothetical protein
MDSAESGDAAGIGLTSMEGLLERVGGQHP